MHISYNWLKNYVNTGKTPEELSVLLTDCGLEVEGLEKVEAVPGGLKGVVVGKVLSSVQHPNADRLVLTSVDAGGDDPLPIVCGAPNVREGQKVLVATVGTTLYSEKGPFEIKKAKIRGEHSEGMICAEDELGLGDSHEGIMVLPEDAPVGMPAAEYLALEEDWMFEIGLTPNRIDAASHIGVARDVVAVLNHKHNKRDYRVLWPDVSGFKPDNDQMPVEVRIEDPEACPRYSSLTLSGVRVQDSPDWLRQRLLSIGLKPVNNVVDVTNFVLHELGQPLHAFDVAAITGEKVIVRKPPKGKLFETLEGEKLELTGEDLMICNEQDPMCMGGILGGIHSGVTETTTRVFLESACFNPVTIRKSARHHGLKTEASFRFERGSDPEMTVFALKRAALLIREVAGGTISSPVNDVFPVIFPRPQIDLGFHHVNTLIGKTLTPEEIRGILEDLDFEILSESNTGYRLTVPLYRVDVTRPADVIEEVLRIYGYNNVGVPSKMRSSIVISPKPDNEQLQNVVADLLSSRGFNEIMNNSLTRAAYYEQEGFKPGQSVSIVNPLSQDLNVMRQSLLFGGLEVIRYNQNRRVEDMKLYEFGNIYSRDAGGNPANPHEAYSERLVLGLFMSGRRQPENWHEPFPATDFFDLKNAVFAVLQRLGTDKDGLRVKQQEGPAPFAYSMDVFAENDRVATLGMLDKKTVQRFDLKDEVFYAVIEWEALLPLLAAQELLYEEVPRYPGVRRDLALLVDREVSFAEVERIACETEKKLLRDVNLFDVYQDEKLGRNKKSYAVSFTLLDKGKTLRDKEVDKVMNKLARAYEKKLGASIR
ncbi:MAG: phenylalanine--tRNA ligase subunit beta [Bacteroidales bacterium]